MVIQIDAFEMLKKMHNLGIVRIENAKTKEEIAGLFYISVEEAENLLQELKNYKYVSSIESNSCIKYYLNSSGIIAVCSIFT